MPCASAPGEAPAAQNSASGEGLSRAKETATKSYITWPRPEGVDRTGSGTEGRLCDGHSARGPPRCCTTSGVRENLFPRPRVWYGLKYVSTIDHQVQHLTTTRARRDREARADAVGCAL